MTPEQLKASIIQCAIQGKLVEQRPEDGTAEELYLKIQKEKQELIKAGKIKKEKSLSDIAEDEVPFDIPETWKWVYCRDVMRFINGRAYKKPELLSKGKYPILRVGNFFTNDSWYYSDMELDEDKYCDNGDLLYAWSASFGPKIWDGGKVIFHYHIWKLDYFQPMDINYLYYYLLADTIRIKNSSHGLGFVFVTKEFMEARPIPIPPLEEQHRIVAKIEELLPYVDRYAEAYEKLEEFNAKFPEDMKKSILQYAIQGKLVEQRPEEGTANEILKKIAEKKNTLIKLGDAKKSKTLTSISDDEKLFDIPENWQWVKLGEIAKLITKGTTPRGGNVAYLDEGIGFLRAENVAGFDVLDKSNLKYIDQETHNGYLKRSIIEANDILITIAGTLGRTGLVREEDLPLNANQAVSMVRLVDFSDIDLKYIIYVLNAPEIQKYLTQQKKTTAIPNLTLEIIENCVCPLPPLEEQHRIVAKIEELLPYCDRLVK